MKKQPNLLVVDVETTGFGKNDRTVEIAAITIDANTWQVVDEFDSLINPQRDVGKTSIHGITAAMVEMAPVFEEIVPALANRINNAVVVAHNLPFDSRMLDYEFLRCNIKASLGSGLCTFKATKQKLVVACQEYGIDIGHHHRALADARATAKLAKHVWQGQHDVLSAAKAARIACPSSSASGHTHRRGQAKESASIMQRIVSCVPFPVEFSMKTRYYLDMLDWVFDDNILDADEKRQLKEWAEKLGIDEEEQTQVHRAYLETLIAAAKRDSMITPKEYRIISQVANQLEIRDIEIPEITEVPTAGSIRHGMRVCFTGEAEVAREELIEIAQAAGLQSVGHVTKKGCDLLVAYDVSSSSVKAKNAKKWGIPIMSTKEFLELVSAK